MKDMKDMKDMLRERDSWIVMHKDVNLKNPILVEGLPGIGHVGKLAIEHLISELKATKLATLYSAHFPAQVLVNDDSTIKLVSNDVYYKKRRNAPDIVLITGDSQAASSKGQYAVALAMLSIVKNFNIKRMYTLGGYAVGKEISTPKVIGAVTDPMLIKEMSEYNITFRQFEPSGGIMGISGLLPGLGELYGIEGICLMGETQGYVVDPNSAKIVLKVLSSILNLKIKYKELDIKAKQIEYIMGQIKMTEERNTEQELSYIR